MYIDSMFRSSCNGRVNAILRTPFSFGLEVESMTWSGIFEFRLKEAFSHLENKILFPWENRDSEKVCLCSMFIPFIEYNQMYIEFTRGEPGGRWAINQRVTHSHGKFSKQ